MSLEGYTYETISSLLTVTPGFVSQVKKAYITHGVAGLTLKYRGSQPFLNPDERSAVLTCLQEQKEWSPERLREYIEQSYAIVFQSDQSYYPLLAAAKITYKKTQATNPKQNSELVAVKKEIEALMQKYEQAIIAGDVIVLYLDQCHLLWEDARGYVWGLSSQRMTVPMLNQRERQT